MWKKTKWQSQKQQSLTSRHRCGSKTWTLHLPTGRRRSPVCSWRKEDTFATPLIPRGQGKLIFPQVHPQQLTLASTHNCQRLSWDHSGANPPPSSAYHCSISLDLDLVILPLQERRWVVSCLSYTPTAPPSHDLPFSDHFKGHCDQSWSFFQNGQEWGMCVWLIIYLRGIKTPTHLPLSVCRTSIFHAFPILPRPCQPHSRHFFLICRENELAILLWQ